MVRRAWAADVYGGAGLALGVILSRLPFYGQILYQVDAVNFALALRHFDVATDRPHMPGYLLYVAVGRLANAVVPDPQAALVAISVLASGLAVAGLYWLGVRVFDRTTAVVAAAFLATSPLFWFYGELALPHALDAFVVVVAVLLFHHVRGGRVRLLVPAAVWLGIAGGIRPQTEVFLGPLAIYAAWRAPWRTICWAAVTLAVVNLCWLVPLFELSGGVSRYLAVLHEFTERHQAPTSVLQVGGLWGLERNVRKLAMYSLYGWGAAALPAILAVRQLASVRCDDRLGFFLWWMLPCVTFYSMIHMGQQGLVFVFLPALMLLSAAAVVSLGWTSSPRGRMGLATLLLANGALFVVAPTYPVGSDRLKLLTAETLRRHDAYYLRRIDAIGRRPRAHTVLLAANSRMVEYYFPGYALVPYELGAKWERDEGQPVVHSSASWTAAALGVTPDAEGGFDVVLVDPELEPFNRAPERTRPVGLADGDRLMVLRIGANERLEVGPSGFGVDAVSAAAGPRTEDR